jgi:hypothetical protein
VAAIGLLAGLIAKTATGEEGGGDE